MPNGLRKWSRESARAMPYLRGRHGKSRDSLLMFEVVDDETQQRHEYFRRWRLQAGALFRPASSAGG